MQALAEDPAPTAPTGVSPRWNDAISNEKRMNLSRAFEYLSLPALASYKRHPAE
jgi:hypothetical protein